MAGVEKQHRERILAARRSIGEGVGGKADGVYDVLLHVAGEQGRDYYGERASG